MITAAVLWIYRIDFISWGVQRALENQGLGPASFKIEAISLNRFYARDVSLRGGAIRANDLTAEFGIEDLLAGHMERLEIGGFVTEFAINEDGVTWDGRPLGDPSTPASDTSPIAMLRIDELSFRDAKVKIETAAGVIDTNISATLSIADGVIEGTDVTAEINAALSDTEQKLSLAAPNVTASLPRTGEIGVVFSQASLRLDAYPWQALGVDAEMQWTPEKTDLTLLSARLENLQNPSQLPSFNFSGTGTMEGALISFEADGEALTKEVVKFQAKGSFDRASGVGSAELLPVTVQFRRNGLQPHDLSSALDPSIKDVEGAVSLAGKLTWKDNAITPLITLRLNKLGLSTPSMNMRELTSTITLNQLTPLTTLPNQPLSAILEIPGIPTAQIALRGQLLSSPAFRVQSLSIAIAGGDISTLPFTVRTGQPDIATTLSVTNLDLAEVTKLLSINGLDGTGRLDGEIPLHVKGQQVAIEKGKLTAREAGTLRYRPESLPEAISKSHSSVDLAFQALTDFHYDKLELGLDKDTSGDGTVMLHLQGQNPAVMSGQAFNFNIRVDSNFDRLAEYALVSIRSTQELLNRAARRSGF